MTPSLRPFLSRPVRALFVRALFARVGAVRPRSVGARVVPVGVVFAGVTLAGVLGPVGPFAPDVAGAAPPAAVCPVRPGLRSPVDAPVVDPFRLPDGPYRAGNRGIEYATAPGTVVQAIGAGTVTFAGAIAGERYVSVRHADGLVVSYSYLLEVAVRRGDEVRAGDRIGTTTQRFQLGARRDGSYIDPAPLLGDPRRVRPRLVPDSTPPPSC